jgi:hypothetical protein
MRVSIRVIAFFLFACAGVGHAQTTNYKTHAVFIFSIAKYSQWPSIENNEFVITVLGKSKMYEELVAGTSRHNVNGMKITVLEAETVSQIGKTQIVFVADNKSSLLEELTKATSGKPVMIVTEREGLHKKGAGVSFFVNDQGKLNFDLNMTEMAKRELSMSKSLTSLAASVL